jgi:hypothetical protein
MQTVRWRTMQGPILISKITVFQILFSLSTHDPMHMQNLKDKRCDAGLHLVGTTSCPELHLLNLTLCGQPGPVLPKNLHRFQPSVHDPSFFWHCFRLF